MRLSFDQAIKAEYIASKTPADQIVVSPDLAHAFAERVNQRLADGECHSVQIVNTRLLNLRKLGEANGGLPRLRREYNGRN